MLAAFMMPLSVLAIIPIPKPTKADGSNAGVPGINSDDHQVPVYNRRIKHWPGEIQLEALGHYLEKDNVTDMTVEEAKKLTDWYEPAAKQRDREKYADYYALLAVMAQSITEINGQHNTNNQNQQE